MMIKYDQVVSWMTAWNGKRHLVKIKFISIKYEIYLIIKYQLCFIGGQIHAILIIRC